MVPVASRLRSSATTSTTAKIFQMNRIVSVRAAYLFLDLCLFIVMIMLINLQLNGVIHCVLEV